MGIVRPLLARLLAASLLGALSLACGGQHGGDGPGAGGNGGNDTSGGSFGNAGRSGGGSGAAGLNAVSSSAGGSSVVGGASSGTAGGSGSGAGGASSNAAGTSAIAGGGAAGTSGAGCAYASSVPEVVVPPKALPVRFVALYDPALDDPKNIPSRAGSGQTCAVGAGAPWGECVARWYLTEVNALYAELLGSTAPLLAFGSYETAPNAALTRGHGVADLPSLVNDLALPGVVNTFLVQSIEGAPAGGARLIQDYPSDSAAVVTVVEANASFRVFAHELGHAIGFPHVAGPTVGKTASYPYCGGLQVDAIQGQCDSNTSNIMCEGSGPSFDTCEHGAFLKKIAACWLSGKGSPANNCSVDDDKTGQPRVTCEFDGAVHHCTCANAAITYEATSCIDVLSKYNKTCFPTLPPVPTCHRFPVDTCASGSSCYPDTNANDAHCLPTGSVPIGSNCSALGDCVAGAACIPILGQNKNLCALQCDPNAAAPSTACTADCTYGWSWNDLEACLKL